MTGPPTSYLDHNATSPLLDVAREALIEALDTVIGNPSSAHQDGVRARALLDRSRARIAAAIGASRPDQILFTSGGTESNNLAILGAAARLPGSAALVTTSVEHPSVLRVFEHLRRGGRPVLVVDPDQDGRVPTPRILEAVGHARAGLVSLQLANHETGARQAVAELAAALRGSEVLLHVDAIQAFGKDHLSVQDLEADLVSLSAHKIGGPPGIAALFVRDATRLSPMTFGGSQERSLRPGSTSPALAAGFAAAAAHRVAHIDEARARWSTLTARLDLAIGSLDAEVQRNTPDDAVYNTRNYSFPEVDREALLVSLDLLGVRVSAGAACASGAIEASPVLLATFGDSARASSSVRVSLGPSTDEHEIDHLVDSLRVSLPRCRTA